MFEIKEEKHGMKITTFSDTEKTCKLNLKKNEILKLLLRFF